MTTQITKKQHYVPQVLLRNFIVDRNIADRRNEYINIFNLSDGSFNLVCNPNEDIEKNCRIKNKFYEDFFYDTDNEIEKKFLEEQIETPASDVIRSIVNKKELVLLSEQEKDKEKEEKRKLLRFIASLLSRTPKALHEVNDMLNSSLSQPIRELLRLNDLDENIEKEGRFTFESRSLISMSVLDGTEKYLALEDLELALIFNKSNTDFYISDHPVFDYNWFYRDSSNPEVTSIFTTGLQIFLPISYDLTLCLYDPEIYKYGHRNQRVIEIENSSDINILNSFQISNATSILGFRSSSSIPNIKHLYKRFSTRKIHRWETFITSSNNDGDGTKRTCSFTVRKQLELDRMPSFIHVKKTSKKHTHTVSLRNPDLAQAYYELDRENLSHIQK